MKIDQAVRLRELWNASFTMKLRLRDEKSDECTLHALKSELTEDNLRTLESLVHKLGLQLKETAYYYVIS